MSANKQDLKLKLLMDYVTLLSHSYEERLQGIVDFASQFYANQREYEWTIRRLSSANVKPAEQSDMAPIDFQWPEVMTQWPKLSESVQDFNVQLANDFDVMKQENAELTLEVQTLRKEIETVKSAMQRQALEAEIELKSARDASSQLESDFESYRLKHVANERKQNSLIESLSRSVSEYKQQLFVQKQETLIRHRSVPSNSDIVSHDGNVEETSTSNQDSNYRVADLEFRLAKQRELSDRLKRLLQNKDQLKLVDDYNSLYHKNIDLQNINRRLLEYLKINDIEIDLRDLQELDVDGAIEDLVDQRNAWKQNTRILEHQVYSLQQEMETLKSTTSGIGMTLQNESTPTISRNNDKQVSALRLHHSQPNLNSNISLADLNLRPESNNFTVNECPYCAPAVTINI